MKSLLLVICCSVSLVNCASTPTIEQQVYGSIAGGQCNAAETMILENFLGGQRYYLAALVELDCRNDRNAGVELLALCASMGHEAATDRLRQLGEPLARRASPIPPVSTSSSILEPINQPGSTTSSSMRPEIPAPISNVFLQRTEEVIGARLCHYSDGAVVRIGGGMVCPLTN